ncbi:isopeptide-forming domain-containing fimbrial protein [Streptococcus parasanguinis]|nr:isopeptide-forming domain-containing fimbrial protein [Streptococcus parasanguinis]MCP8992502.1 isopeptide-forming domain-containing fimbrial protein [Streptococcus parasanguinis]MCP9003642.1 isopeptide-forming domain-containing fimbrial protein [Streptococcus parasanguinis]MCP9009647.1 isopeptide-forming domain-containing fimbrial protein [Streptococcus parasanguinis]MCP9034271.1 isopeptide-forming domain-containing fimbrial protein [Streptococcus parasanguinis]
MKNFCKKIFMLFAILFMSLPANLTSALVTHARAEENIVTTQGNKNTKITQNGCSRKIEKTEEIHWRLPRKPIDLVILQDASGSFANTIPSVKKALKTLTTFVSEEDYDENNPRLVKTDDPDTSDRVMVASFQGVDGYNYYNNDTFTGKPDVYGGWGAKYDYQYKSSGLTTNQNAIHSFIDNISVAGGTPTVPAIEDAIKQYNANKGSMANERKTVFLVITDGVANGKRDADGKVRIDYSGTRNRKLQKAWSYNQLSEASQDIIGRVNEVKDAGNTLKGVVGSNGTVVVGFWEDVALFNNDKAQYYDVYLNGFGNYFNIGDNRSVQEIFHEALQGMASPDKEVNGKNVSFYVNEQDNIDKFSARVLESVGAALVKEDIKGEFDVTPGYKVDAVRINGKKIVSEVKDSTKEILGKIEQNGDKVTISVPESVFNPGKNNFDYDLSKEAHAEQVDEDDEQDPPAGYQPAKEQVQVPELTGKFKVGDFETQTIGGHNETVEVQKLEYCYPSATKKIEDQDLSNDTGTIEDPLQLTKKPAYAANLSDKAEEFTYTVNYNFNNVPYEFKKNVMLTDPLDYRLEVVRSSATGPDGPLKTRVVKGQDSAGNERDIVVADVPSDGTNYNYLVLKQAELKITVKLKEEFRKDQASKNYLALLQDSNGFGLVNQGNIMWNGEDDSPNPDPHAKTADKPSTIRRSNPVYVKPPLSTDIEKKVNEKEHADLATEDELFEYKVSVPWPGTADKFTVTDTVVPELEVQESTIKATIDGKTYAALTKATTLKDQTVEISLDKADMDRLTRLVNRRGGDEVKKLDLVFQAKIRPNADLSKYKKNGTIKVPNKADVALNDIKKTSNEVTVTPPKPKEPTVEKKINETLEDYQTFEGQPYTYNISTAIPADVSSYKKFVISDTLDNDLEFDGEATIKGDAADLFTVEKNGQTVTATVKPGKFKDLAKYSTVELIIPAKVKQGVSGKVIDNKAKVEYTNKSNVDKEVESTPVHVTPPPVTKKINENLDHLDIPTGEQYKYNIKTKLPTDIKDYKKFVITDTLENELSVINEGETKPVIKGAAAAFFDVEVQGQTVTATMKNFATAADLAGQEVELEIPAKINDGVTRVKIPNTAKISYTDKNDHSGEKETKPVTVTPPSEPTVKKKINEKLDTAVIGAETDYTYNIKAKLPNDITSYKSFVITDTLDENLQVGEATITGEANKFFTVTGTGQTVTATMKDFENAGDYAGKEVELVIKAKVKKESTAEAIENKAKITYTNKNNQQGEKETKPVTVTPPPITKKVNNQEHADLNKLSESFTYTVDTKVPEVADKFEVSDQLVNELTFDGDATVEVDGQKATDLTVQTNGQTLSVTFDKDQVKEYAGKAVHITFKAKIKDNVSYDALLAAYPNPAGDKPLVPNTASFIINDNPDSKKESTPVTVTPPPTSTPELKKKVNGQERYELTKRDEEFTYTLTTEMPANASVFEITDELKDVLQFVGKDGSATVKIDGKAAGKKATVTVKDQTIKITFAEASVKADAGKAIEVTFKAKIKDGANLASYITSAGTTEIPNKASYDIDNNPKYHKDSNEVPVTPPTPKEPEIKKDVNEKPAETLVNRNDTFTYNVNTTVPTDATAFEVTDTLVDVLEFAGASSASVNGEAIAPEQIKVEGQTITLSLTEAQVKANGGKAVKLSFTAKIKDGANLSAYITKDGKTEVPNKASYKVDFPNKPGVTKDSNTVPVTPPTPGEPEIKKDVNGKPAETLQARNEEFTYHVNTEVPADATAFEVHDTLVDVLEFADGTGRATATLGEEALAPEQIKVDGQKITVTLTEDQVKANAGKAVKLTFTAKIKDGANLSAYVTKEGKTEVPNKASYKASFPNKPGVTKDSNEVPVTPPSPELPPIEKKVNNEDQATLGARDEVFTYKVTTQVPQDVTGFAVYDTIEKVLEFAGENAEAVATLDGQALDASHISFKGQKITVKLTEEEAKANAGKTVELTFKAKIKDGANLSEYVNEDGVTRVPNTAKYNFNNDPGTEQKSKPVPVIPPTPGEPEIKKDVNDKPAETLAKRDEVFTYHVNTNVPTDATAFEVHDTLVDVLEFAGASSASLNGKELKANQIKVDGQTITLTLTEEQVKENGGKAVNLTFTAKIKKGANLGAYLTPAGKTEIPNKASYKVDFPNKPGVTKDSNTVPVTPPNPGQPEIEKQVNGAAEALLGDRDEVFTYTINTVMPEDATAFAVTDTLDPVLEFEGTANVTLDGKATDATVTTDGQTLTVNFPEATVKSSAGKKVQVTFKAKVKADADLTPYLTDRGYTVPNTASYILNNNPGLKKDSNTVPVVVPKVPEPEISKKINRTLDHLDVDYDAGYMYNVNTKLPADIDKYKEFTVTDTLEPVLEIAGTPVAYVDGYDAKEALETKVEGNTVTVTVKDFARLKGFKEIQLYIPSKLKSGSDLTPYAEQLVPNKATVSFKDRNGQSGNKESKPVTVKPRDPEKPRDPDPNRPQKTVGPEDGSAPGSVYRLKTAGELFRFDITTPVPTDPKDENGNPVKDQYGRDVKTKLTNLTFSDEIDKALKVKKIALKVENAQFASIQAALQAKLDQAKQELKDLAGQPTTGSIAEKVAAAEAKVADLTAQVEAAKTAAAEDAESAEKAAAVTTLEASLKAAQDELTALKENADKSGGLPTSADQKQAQEKLEQEIKSLEEAKAKLDKAVENLSKVSNERGEITGDALSAFATVTYDEATNLVTVEITDETILDTLKGSTLRLVLYTSFKDGVDVSKYVDNGVPNVAKVSFNHKPKETYEVKVFPPAPNTPPPGPYTPPTPVIPPAPNGDLPPAPIPDKPKPKKPTPKVPEQPQPILPKTAAVDSPVMNLVGGLMLGMASLLIWKRKKEQ